MAELADALDLGSSGNTRAGSTPVIRIFESTENGIFRCFFCKYKRRAYYGLH